MIKPRRQPSKLAIRVLSCFVAGHAGEAFLGDLLEKFHEGQSPTWLWQEVTSAILLSFVATLRSRRAEIIFAILGTASELLWFMSPWMGTAWRSSTFQSLSGWGVLWPFPLGVMYGFCFQAALFTALNLILLCIFWSIKRLWRWTNVIRVILISFPLLTVGQLVVALLMRPYDAVLHWVVVFGVLTIAVFRSNSPSGRASVWI
jgi:hypothetical protein